MTVDVTQWFPPGLTDEQIQEYLDAYPYDPHGAAAAAWLDYAATLPICEDGTSLNGVESVATGAQSIKFGKNGGGALGCALDKAEFHRVRARIKTPQYGPTYQVHAHPTASEACCGYPDTRPCWEGHPPDYSGQQP